MNAFRRGAERELRCATPDGLAVTPAAPADLRLRLLEPRYESAW
ncbi:hypothetical protein ACFRCW_29235 [Streptomyces sp. NPDC056653]